MLPRGILGHQRVSERKKWSNESRPAPAQISSIMCAHVCVCVCSVHILCESVLCRIRSMTYDYVLEKMCVAFAVQKRNILRWVFREFKRIAR